MIDQKKDLKPFIGLIALAFGALLLRLIHLGTLYDSPLFERPVGGHVPYFQLAETIAGGNLLPLDHPFTLSSPAFAYLIAFFYKIVGVHNFAAIRHLGILCDSFNVVLVFLLTRKLFLGRYVSYVAATLYALSSVAIFYSAELTPVPYVILFLL